MVGLYVTHWRTFVTGTLHFGMSVCCGALHVLISLRFDIAEAQWCIIGVQLISCFLGPDVWGIDLLHPFHSTLSLELRNAVLFTMYVSNCIVHLALLTLTRVAGTAHSCWQHATVITTKKTAGDKDETHGGTEPLNTSDSHYLYPAFPFMLLLLLVEINTRFGCLESQV
jgi:hypothetical protein